MWDSQRAPTHVTCLHISLLCVPHAFLHTQENAHPEGNMWCKEKLRRKETVFVLLTLLHQKFRCHVECQLPPTRLSKFLWARTEVSGTVVGQGPWYRSHPAALFLSGTQKTGQPIWSTFKTEAHDSLTSHLNVVITFSKPHLIPNKLNSSLLMCEYKHRHRNRCHKCTQFQMSWWLYQSSHNHH